MNGFCIVARQPGDRCVGPVDEAGKGARDGANVQEIELLGTVLLAAQEQSR